MEIKLDLKDRKILRELDMNARASYASLGKKVRLSKQVVKYRVDKLESQNIIQGYNALIDISKLGQTIYVVYFKLVQISSSKEKEWIDKIEKHPSVLAVGKNAGQWDMTIAIRCSNNQNLDSVLKEIISNKSENIKEKLITSEIEATYFAMDIIHKEKIKETSTSNNPPIEKIDKEDEQIISLLSHNARMSLLDISEKVKMSPNGVKHKRKNLEKKKIIIGYKTKINYEKLGYLHFRVFLHLGKFTNELYENIKDFLNHRGNVESISRYMGYADVDFRCYSQDIVELYNLISELKDNFLQNIIGVDSMPIFRWENINYYSKK
ncbi:Lrp/AsnC family transcriptional regulator [archaeon]|jgi:Lrp/AsnC family transcriptional regulator, leucine-responsive regulatory protein|nr:Lrp/AsnC family transcriptional regulator [archaeon]